MSRYQAGSLYICLIVVWTGSIEAGKSLCFLNICSVSVSLHCVFEENKTLRIIRDKCVKTGLYIYIYIYIYIFVIQCLVRVNNQKQ